MDEELVQVLANTLSPEWSVRQEAELALNHARTNPAFPGSLANVAAQEGVDIAVRQSALTNLRLFIDKNWNPVDVQDEQPIPIAKETRDELKRILLQITLSREDKKKIKILASYAVGKIAMHDVPELWPDLIPTLMNAIPNGTDAQVHGALRTIQDIVEDSLNESQFFSMAREITATVSGLAFDKNRHHTLRALAISIFRQCFVLIDTVKGEYMDEVVQFSEELLKTWHPFFMGILEERLPPPAQGQPRNQPPNWDDVIMLKLQVLKTLLKIKMVLPKVLTPRALDYFSAVWGDLMTLMDLHKELYVENETLDRLEDVDALPYSLDFLVLEELDVMHQFLKAKPIDEKLRQQLTEAASPAQTQWMMQIMQMLTAFSRITQEEEGLWDIDCSLYLAEEASASANYTSRTCAGDVLIKLGELYNQAALEGLVSYTKMLFETSTPDWRSQEAALYLFNMIAGDFADTEKPIPPQTSEAYLSLVDHAISQNDSPFLRARGFLVGSTLTRVYNTPDTLINRTLSCINSDEAEVVRVSCIKAVEHLALAKRIPEEQQIPTLLAIHQYIQSKDADELEEADELLVTLMEALRMVVSVNPRIALSDSVQALEILFMLGRVGASNFQVNLLVSEALEGIVSALTDPDSYTALSRKVLPLLTPAFDRPDLSGEQPDIMVAVELLVVLVTGGTEPLPAGFVAACLPKLKRLLLESDEGEILRPAAEALKFLLMHDHQQVFEWVDEDDRSGLEVCLRVLDRLLAPSMEDNSASEAGGLAAELVEKAGHERLGPFLPELLKVVASRLVTANAAAFIQSLILVFARLSLVGAHDVVEFLSQCQIGGQTGLEVVIAKWLENSVVFAGYDEIRQNVIALSKLYALNDQRLSQMMVKGDLIVPEDDIIVTRSRSKQRPDQFTIIPASLKILKVLIQEIVSASGNRSAAGVAAGLARAAAELDEDDGDDNWEDDPDVLDLGLGSSKEQLLAFGLEGGGGGREQDDETLAYLTEFFLVAARDNVANFGEWYKMLTDEERQKLAQLTSH